METSRTQAVDDAAEIGDYHSATTTALNTDIQHFTTSRCMVEVSPVKTVFESVVAILTLVRVGFPVQFLYFHLLIGDRTRTA